MRACRHPLACSWRSISTCNAAVARSLIIASAHHELQHFGFHCSCAQLALCFSLSLAAVSLSISLPALRVSLCISLHVSLRRLRVSLSPPPSLSLCFSPLPPRLPPSLSSPQPQLFLASASVAQSTEVDHDLTSLPLLVRQRYT